MDQHRKIALKKISLQMTFESAYRIIFQNIHMEINAFRFFIRVIRFVESNLQINLKFSYKKKTNLCLILKYFIL